MKFFSRFLQCISSMLYRPFVRAVFVSPQRMIFSYMLLAHAHLLLNQLDTHIVRLDIPNSRHNTQRFETIGRWNWTLNHLEMPCYRLKGWQVIVYSTLDDVFASLLQRPNVNSQVQLYVFQKSMESFVRNVILHYYSKVKVYTHQSGWLGGWMILVEHVNENKLLLNWQ